MPDLQTAPSPPNDLGDKAPDGHLERYKAQLAVWAEEQNAEAALRPQMAVLLGGFAQTGLRSLLFVNGGALVGLLAMVGNVWGRPGAAELAARVQAPAKLLAFGLLCAFIATAAAYASQLLFLDYRSYPWGYKAGARTRGVCVGLCIVSLALFAWGGSSAISAIGKRTCQPSSQSTGCMVNHSTR